MLRRFISLVQICISYLFFSVYFKNYIDPKKLDIQNVYQQMLVNDLNQTAYICAGFGAILFGMALSPFCQRKTKDEFIIEEETAK